MLDAALDRREILRGRGRGLDQVEHPRGTGVAGRGAPATVGQHHHHGAGRRRWEGISGAERDGQRVHPGDRLGERRAADDHLGDARRSGELRAADRDSPGVGRVRHDRRRARVGVRRRRGRGVGDARHLGNRAQRRGVDAHGQQRLPGQLPGAVGRPICGRAPDPCGEPRRQESSDRGERAVPHIGLNAPGRPSLVS